MLEADLLNRLRHFAVVRIRDVRNHQPDRLCSLRAQAPSNVAGVIAQLGNRLEDSFPSLHGNRTRAVVNDVGHRGRHYPRKPGDIVTGHPWLSDRRGTPRPVALRRAHILKALAGEYWEVGSLVK